MKGKEKMMKSILNTLALNGFTLNIEVENDLSISGDISMNDIKRDFYLTNKDFTLIEFVYDYSTGTYNDNVLLEVLTDDLGLITTMTKEIFDNIDNEIKGEELYLEYMKG
jgi:hypothetical protein